nr:reverse transcriptase [Tanacetum cinerariifolium]
ASNGESMGSMRILNAIKAKTEVPKVIGKGLQYVEATINGVKVCALVDSGATHNFVDGGKTCMVSTERDAKSGSKTLSAMQFKKGFNKSEPCYLAVTRLETDEGSSKVEVPKVIERVLDEFKDVMPKELPKKLPPTREVDHTIELESGEILYQVRLEIGVLPSTDSGGRRGQDDVYHEKNQAWIWDEECQAAFESLKKAVMEEPVLRLPDVTMPFELHTAASDFAIGGVLMQDGHSIAFESQKLNETERKEGDDGGCPLLEDLEALFVGFEIRNQDG